MARLAPATRAVTRPEAERPRLELSGPKLGLALERLLAGTEEHGGVERYVEALQLKSAVFRQTFEQGPPDRAALMALCALIATVRRRVGPYLAPERLPALQAAIIRLLDGRADTSTTDERVAAFRRAFPADRTHRWVHDLAGELLHNVDPERYPLMCRWVWDGESGTGVIREIWHADDVDRVAIDVPSRYDTYLVLREELAQYLAANGVFRDVLHYVDLLTAQVYADYIGEQGGAYLRSDFSSPEDPVAHTRRLLGLDGIGAGGRTRLKAVDGEAFVVADAKLAD